MKELELTFKYKTKLGNANFMQFKSKKTLDDFSQKLKPVKKKKVSYMNFNTKSYK